MASMLLLKEAPSMSQMGLTTGPQQLMTKCGSPISSKFSMPSSFVRMAATSSSSSCPLGLSSSFGMHSSSVMKACYGFRNLSTLPPCCKARTVDSPRMMKESSAFAGNGLGSLHFREVGDVGTRKRRGMRTVRASHYDGTLPLNVPARDDSSRENGPATSTSDNPPDSSTLQQKSSSSVTSASLQKSRKNYIINAIEDRVERIIFDFRFLTLFGVAGSLLGAVLCFLKGCLFVGYSYRDYIRACLGGVHTSRVMLYLVEAVDVYLMGTVMLIFGMGLYELFVSSLEVPSIGCETEGGARSTVCNSNLFGLFRLQTRPKWLEIRSLDELKTKLGHVIVMILLVGMFEKSKKIVVHTAIDFLAFSASILFSSVALYLLALLNSDPDKPEPRGVKQA